MFGMKKKEEEGEDEIEETDAKEEKKSDNVETGNPKLDMEMTRIKAQIEGFAEIRKANSERFSRISEQIGELRGMIMDSNKSVGAIEVKATRAADLVASVQPDKLMIDVRKTEGKVEGLKANIDSNEAILADVRKNLKEMRQQMNFYKGIDQVINLNEEVKKEIMEIKRIEANTKKHADRIDTVYIEFNKKFTDFEKYDSQVKNVSSTLKRLETDFDKIKVKLEIKEDKKEFETLLGKFNEFEKHTTNILNLLDERSKQAKSSMLNDFNSIKQRVADKYELDMKKELPPKEKKGLFGFMNKKGGEKGVEGEKAAPEEPATPAATPVAE